MVHSDSISSGAKICSSQWLHDNLKNTKVFDCSWYLPTMKRDTLKEFNQSRIPGSIFFDIDSVKDHSSNLPHMLPTEAEFNRFMDENGISNDDTIVVYDTYGFQGACRVYWHLEALGHSNVKLLDGGFKEWKSLGMPTVENVPFVKSGSGSTGYKSQINPNVIRSKSQILDAIEHIRANPQNPQTTIIDARPGPRFDGKEPEPRPGLTCGHMPFAINVPFPKLVKTAESGGAKCKSPEELVEIFKSANPKINLENDQIITTCGSGVTAACLYVALKRAGANNIAVYDGSWAEYGSDSTNPIETTK
ncbi:hypothetical protein BB558_005147 [Smittium angustum]|uniref:Rhodanese domain-containing protein n=1 Tax=Smittium angustum TaxID=133377 RepID=A0A2U1J198_SMIAN|nr:hypothetical protein BB558_005147 [Smittium angustum]